MNSLLNKTKLTVVRYGEYYLDDEFNNVLGEPKNILIRCSIQPFREGNQTVLMPDGTQIKGGQIIYTTTQLRTDSPDGKYAADETVIDGIQYKCFYEENWNRYLSQRHYKYVFIRKDKQ